MDDDGLWLDEERLSATDVQKVADLMAGYQWGDQVPTELVDLLAAHAGDPEFAKQLTQNVGLPVLAAFITNMSNTLAADLGLPWIPRGQGFPHVGESYTRMIELLGSTYSLAALTMSPDELTQFCALWSNQISDHPASATPLSLVISRGVWPDEFLTAITDAIENSGDAGYWSSSGAPIIVDPGRRGSDGSPLQITDPLYGVFSAAVASPEWLVERYGSGPLTEVVTDVDGALDQTVSVPEALRALIADRGLGDEGTVQAFLYAMSVASLWEETTGQNTSFASDVAAMIGVMDREARLWEAKPWIVKYGTLLSAGVATVAGFAAILVPGPGWVVTGLTWVSVGAAVTHLGLSIYDQDWEAVAWDVAGLILLPLSIAGVTVLVRIAKADIALLRAGGTVRLFGRDIIMMENGRLGFLNPAEVAVRADLVKYLRGLEGLDPAAVTLYERTGIWPADVQIPAGSTVFKPGLKPGTYDIAWPEADGFVLNDLGKAATDPLTQTRGRIIDREGPSNGRFTCPVVDGKSVPHSQRSTPWVEDPAQLHTYQFTDDISNIRAHYDSAPADVRLRIDKLMGEIGLSWKQVSVVQVGEIALVEHFPGAVGGGIQWQLPFTVDDLLALGMLIEI